MRLKLSVLLVALALSISLLPVTTVTAETGARGTNQGTPPIYEKSISFTGRTDGSVQGTFSNYKRTVDVNIVAKGSGAIVTVELVPQTQPTLSFELTYLVVGTESVLLDVKKPSVNPKPDQTWKIEIDAYGFSQSRSSPVSTESITVQVFPVDSFTEENVVNALMP
ncbi:MAG TPA: hypothetical protein VNZ52_12940 [Candidatus Thermoplasmatota archaeon]|nr:hypothetical protein [Candidatus Thermoplasmatota archaeon]